MRLKRTERQKDEIIRELQRVEAVNHSLSQDKFCIQEAYKKRDE